MSRGRGVQTTLEWNVLDLHVSASSVAVGAISTHSLTYQSALSKCPFSMAGAKSLRKAQRIYITTKHRKCFNQIWLGQPRAGQGQKQKWQSSPQSSLESSSLSERALLLPQLFLSWSSSLTPSNPFWTLVNPPQFPSLSQGMPESQAVSKGSNKRTYLIYIYIYIIDLSSYQDQKCQQRISSTNAGQVSAGFGALLLRGQATVCLENCLPPTLQDFPFKNLFLLRLRYAIFILRPWFLRSSFFSPMARPPHR